MLYVQHKYWEWGKAWPAAQNTDLSQPVEITLRAAGGVDGHDCQLRVPPRTLWGGDGPSGLSQSGWPHTVSFSCRQGPSGPARCGFSKIHTRTEAATPGTEKLGVLHELRLLRTATPQQVPLLRSSLALGASATWRPVRTNRDPDCAGTGTPRAWTLLPSPPPRRPTQRPGPCVRRVLWTEGRR